jgi:hypothetical protein
MNPLIGQPVTWTDCEGSHTGTIDEVWADQGIAVVVGSEHGMSATWFVPLAELV